jgi:hypothetical protein
MRALKLSLLLTFFVLVNSLSEKQENFAVFVALKAILTDYFAVNEPKINVGFYGRNSGVLVDKLLKETSLELSVQVIEFGSAKNQEIFYPLILLFDSVWHFDVFNASIYAKKPINSIVYIQNASNEYLYRNGLGKEAQNIIRVVNDTAVDLVTSFRYSPGNCNGSVYRTINQFSINTMRWKNDTFFPEKYSNFYNCSLRLAYSKFLTEFSDPSASFLFWDILAQDLNFSLERVQLPRPENDYDLRMHFSIQADHEFESYEFSSAIFDDFMTLTVPAGEPYTQLEKMFLMFDKETWICIGVTLGLGWILIQIINFMSIQIQRFVFGRDIRTPSLNLADIFLNGGQNRMPRRNFARFILILFIVWSLIIRTCYQSEMYKNLQSDMRKPRITSIDGLNENNFTLVYLTFNEGLFDEIKSKRKV